MNSDPGKRRHILFIPSWYFDKEAEGMFIHEHARMTALQGHQVGLIYLRHGGLFDKRILSSETEDQIRVVIRRSFLLPKIPGLIEIWKRQYLHLYQEYCTRHGRPDCIHAHGYLGGIAACDISMRTRTPYLITEHSTALPEGSVPDYHKNELRRAYHNAGALIAVSNFLRDAMMKWLRTPKEIRVIGNPVDFNRYRVHKKQQSERIRLIAIGSLEPRKNYALMFSALQMIREPDNVALTIVGTGPELKNLIAHAKRLHIQDKITFAGYVPGQELITLLHSSDFLVSSSTMENFGVAIIEALACGIPVVITPSGGPEEYLLPGAGICASSQDPEALAEAIWKVIARRHDFDPAWIRSSVKDKFDFPVIGQQINAVYAHLLRPIAK